MATSRSQAWSAERTKMSKGEQTRQEIIRKAASIFNQSLRSYRPVRSHEGDRRWVACSRVEGYLNGERRTVAKQDPTWRNDEFAGIAPQTRPRDAACADSVKRAET
jgi:hypothetical protein